MKKNDESTLIAKKKKMYSPDLKIESIWLLQQKSQN